MDMKAKLLAKLEGDRLAKHLGIKVVDAKPGYAKAEAEVTEEGLNSLDITHGAFVFAVADMAFAAASNFTGPAVALNMNISFVKATRKGDRLTAVATEDNVTRKTGLYRIVVTDGSGETVAVVEGLVYRKG